MKSGLSLIVLSGVASLNRTRNLPPLICQYCPNNLSSGSLCSLDVMMKSYLSASKFFIIEAWHFNVPTNVEAIFKVKASFSQLGIFFSWQFSIQSAMARKNDGLLSPITAVFPE